jgi:hypothetical protein
MCLEGRKERGKGASADVRQAKVFIGISRHQSTCIWKEGRKEEERELLLMYDKPKLLSAHHNAKNTCIWKEGRKEGRKGVWLAVPCSGVCFEGAVKLTAAGTFPSV